MHSFLAIMGKQSGWANANDISFSRKANRLRWHTPWGIPGIPKGRFDLYAGLCIFEKLTTRYVWVDFLRCKRSLYG